MTIEVTARNGRGSAIGTYTALDAEDAVAWMQRNSHATFVDGYTVGGFGIVRVSPSRLSFSWLDGEFVAGDAKTLLAALRERGQL